ncbi:unnamed protein product [Caretta caretta]
MKDVEGETSKIRGDWREEGYVKTKEGQDIKGMIDHVKSGQKIKDDKEEGSGQETSSFQRKGQYSAAWGEESKQLLYTTLSMS